jgi:hypothetical protein
VDHPGTQVADTSQFATIDAFAAALAAAPVDVAVRPANADGLPGGFDVQYVSPLEGTVQFGWNAPLVVNGRSVPIHRNFRYDNPFVKAPVGATEYRVRAGKAQLVLDFAAGTRVATAG